MSAHIISSLYEIIALPFTLPLSRINHFPKPLSRINHFPKPLSRIKPQTINRTLSPSHASNLLPSASRRRPPPDQAPVRYRCTHAFPSSSPCIALRCAHWLQHHHWLLHHRSAAPHCPPSGFCGGLTTFSSFRLVNAPQCVAATIAL
jgi:hypothetical protein